MKRLVIRLSVLSVVVVLGLIAIAQARHSLRAGGAQETAAAPVALPEGAPRPLDAAPVANPLQERSSVDAFRQSVPPQASLDPFAARFERSAAVEEDIPSAEVALAQHEVPVPEQRALPRELALPAATAAPPQESAQDSQEYQEPQQYAAATEPRYAQRSMAARAAAQYAPQPEQSAPLAEPRALPSQAARSVLAQPAPSVAAEVEDPRYSAPQESYAAPAQPIQQTPAVAEPAYPAPASNYSMPSVVDPAEAQPLASAPQATGTGTPGGQHLEGEQAASLTIRKVAPQAMQVGKPCKFDIVIRNNGQNAARGVEVHDQVPRGTTLVRTEPQATQSPDGRLIWQLGDVAAGEEVTLQMHLMPVAEGEIGSVATLHFSADASARVVATKPELALRLSAEPKVMIGDTIRLSIELSNPGSGPATGVMLFENIPAGVSHPAGSSLEFEVGTLAAGETRQLELELTAEQAGMVENVLTATGDANLQVQESASFEVIAPALDVAVEGPSRRYLERPATYTLSVGNPGTASAKDVLLTTYLPQEMKFVKANNSGQYDPATHSVSWGLAELPAKQSGSVELVAVPTEPGELNLRVEGKAERGLTDEAQQTIQVEGLAAIMFSVADLQDPIGLSGETTYEIRIVNQGSKASAGVRLVVHVPPGLKALSASGPTPFEIAGGQVLFAPLARLAPKADTTYHVKLQAVGPGDQRVRVQVDTDELQTPVTKEESTRVYSDQ